MFQIMKKVFPVPASIEHAIWCNYLDIKEGGEFVKGYTASDFLFVKVCASHLCLANPGVTVSL